jgi:ribulose-5-phosphate 4-epimerase/fuculose-1-phosphate aldolase
MNDEGYIKFQPHWIKKPPFPKDWFADLIKARQILFEGNLIGAYPTGIGFGNISTRFIPLPATSNKQPAISNQFLISGSATGNIQQLSNQHFSLVTSVDIENNSLICEGPVIASSESMSHAVIYRECPKVQAVVHVHHLGLWQQLLHKIPTTDALAKYGTPEMAYSIVELLKKTDLRDTKLFVMEGHEEGVFSFGDSLDEAAEIIFKVLNANK